MTVSEGAFRAALRDPALPVPPGLTDATGAPAGKRFDVYRNNVALSLIEAIRAGFPVLAKLLGPAKFDLLARAFIRRHAPETPILHQYGHRLPTFLQDFTPLEHLGYLPDIARLEQAIRQSYHAADAPPVDPAKLASLPPETLVLKLAPPVRLIRSDWPIFDIWRFNMEDKAPKPRPGAQAVLVTRPEFDPHPHLLSKAQADVLTEIMNARPLATALDAAPEGFDLTPLLQLLLAQAAISECSTQG